MRLSAALIVKDEADHLRRCLGSIQGIVDEIVVVDTGSSDDSVAVAESFGALVLHRPWDGDFGAPRNLGLDHVTGDWVLYLDADEHLSPTSRAHVEAELADPEERYVAKRVLLRTRRHFTPLRELRLWRHHPDIRFHGAVHETHARAIADVARAEGREVGEAELLIEHEGYHGDLTHKFRRNLPILERQVQVDPERVYLWCDLGRARNGLGDRPGAEEAWRQGVAVVREHGPRTSVDCLAFTDLIIALAGDGTPQPELVAEADRLFPGNALVDWAGMVDAVARDDHDAVIERATRLLAVDPAELARQALAIDARALGHWALNARGMARFHLGDFAGAAHDFAEAERLAPAVRDYAIKRRLAEARLAAGSLPTNR